MWHYFDARIVSGCITLIWPRNEGRLYKKQGGACQAGSQAVPAYYNKSPVTMMLGSTRPQDSAGERVHTSFTLLLITLGEGVRRMHFCNFGGSWWKLITTRWISSYWQTLEWLSTSEVSDWGMLFGWSRRWIPCSFIDIKCEQRNGKG